MLESGDSLVLPATSGATTANTLIRIESATMIGIDAIIIVVAIIIDIPISLTQSHCLVDIVTNAGAGKK